jgi:hypothetical protein
VKAERASERGVSPLNHHEPCSMLRTKRWQECHDPTHVWSVPCTDMHGTLSEVEKARGYGAVCYKYGYMCHTTMFYMHWRWAGNRTMFYIGVHVFHGMFCMHWRWAGSRTIFYIGVHVFHGNALHALALGWQPYIILYKGTCVTRHCFTCIGAGLAAIQCFTYGYMCHTTIFYMHWRWAGSRTKFFIGVHLFQGNVLRALALGWQPYNILHWGTWVT